MIGVISVDKPAGLTSRDVVNRVQRLVRPAKAGHAGTLDPLATGVLVVCVGQATRLIEFIQRAAKTYRATFLLGRYSDTEDLEGEVHALCSPPIPSSPQIVEACRQFVGEILQRPPAYSALKVGGRRAYQLARQGKEVQLAERPTRIDAIDVLDYDYPRLSLDITCGSGTYIRSLGRDIAESLGTSAVMESLIRTGVGSLTLERACHLDQLSPASLAECLRPPREALSHFPQVVLDEHECQETRFGRAIPDRWNVGSRQPPRPQQPSEPVPSDPVSKPVPSKPVPSEKRPEPLVVGLDPAGQVVAVFQCKAERLAPCRVLNPDE